MAESSNSAMDESAPLVMDEVLQQMLHDDQEEWEYEYSGRETETYYLTLELSYPEFKGASAKMNIHSRGGYYKNWQDTTGGADPTSRPSAGAAGAGSRAALAEDHVQVKDDVSSNDEAPTAAAERDEDDEDTMIDPALRSSKGKEPVRKNIDLTRESTTREPTAEPAASGDAPSPSHDQEPEPREEIQILELHSDHPLISYRGRLFEGEWAEVIGTEALLARHDEEHPLPALRRVGGNIDVLGALSSRIVTKEKVATARHKEGADPLAAMRAELKIQVPAGKIDRTGARKQQARFLENLIALKKIKGQTDDVTVYALDGAGKDFDDKKDPDYKPRRKRTAAAAALGTPAVRGGGGGGGRRGRGRLATAGRGRQGRVASQPRSTPTPARWEDLEEQEEGGEEASEMMDEYEDDDVSMSMG